MIKISNIFLSLLLLTELSAQNNNEDSVKTYVTDPVVITGTRYATFKSNLSSSISVVDKNEIVESNEVNVLSAVENKVPGLFLVQNNFIGFGAGSPSAGGFSIRGISGEPNAQILVLIDGQPQFMGIFGHPIIDALSSSTVERVEVIRGPASILYGSNAMGGTINILSKEIPDNTIDLNLSSFYGSFNSYGVSGNAGYNGDDFGIFASFNNANSEGHRTDAKDDFRNNTGFAKINYDFNENFRVSVDGNISDAEFYDPGPVTSITEDNFYKYLRSRGALSFSNFFNSISGALKFFYSYGKHDFADGWKSTDDMKGITFYQNLNYLEGITFTLGFDYKEYGGKGSNAGLESNPNIPPFVKKGLSTEHSNTEFAVYGFVRDSLFKELNLEAGVRYTKNNLFDAEIIPQFGIVYSPVQTTSFKVSVGKAYRNPTILDLYLFPPSNENLKPESMWNYELGVTQYLLNYKLLLELTGFYIEAENLITSPPPPPPLIQRSNTGSFINKGVEFSGRYFINENVDLSLNYSFLNTSTPVLYSPEHNLNFSIDYHYKILKIILDFKQVSGLYSNLQPQVKEDYFLFNTAVNLALFQPLTLFVKGENLFDKDYMVDYGYPMPGRSVIAGIRLNN